MAEIGRKLPSLRSFLWDICCEKKGFFKETCAFKDRLKHPSGWPQVANFWGSKTFRRLFWEPEKSWQREKTVRKKHFSRLHLGYNMKTSTGP